MVRVGPLAALGCAAALLSAGCAPGPVDLHGKQCPCGQGWHCNTATNVCMEGSGDGGNPMGPDGGSPDAGSPDAGPAPVDTACDDILSSAIFCDGFEDATLSAWESKYSMYGSFGQETTRVYRGRGSLHALTTMGMGYANLYDEPLPAISSGDLYARFYAYIPSGFTAVLADFLYMGSTTDPYDGMYVGISAAESMNLYFDMGTYYVQSGVDAFPRDRWMCIQVHLGLSDSSGTAELRVDGAVIASDSGIDTLPAGGYTDLSAGIVYTDPTQSKAQVYLDDLAVGTSPLPCDP